MHCYIDYLLLLIEGNVSRYNSEYSIQSGASSGSGGGHTASSSIHESFTTTTSATSPSMSLPSLLVPQKQTIHLTTRNYIRNQQKHIRLCELWLMAAEWYFALSEWDEALKAISEAEAVCPSHHDICYLLAKINHNKTKCTTIMDGVIDQKQQQQHGTELASTIQFLEKGLLIRPGHVGCQLELAKLYMEQQDLCLAEEILISMTQRFGWDCAEAW
jgi:tetratricopeptide (TPR) repeat protein